MRTITIDHCGFMSEYLADSFVEQLQKAIPDGVNVKKNFLEKRHIFQIREGGKKFYRREGPQAHMGDMSIRQMTDIVAKVATYQYLPDDDLARSLTIDHCGFLSEFVADTLVEKLKKAIPSVNVQKNYSAKGEVFQLREGGRKFYCGDGQLVNRTDFWFSEVDCVVNKVLTYEYLPENEAPAERKRTITIDHCGSLSRMQAEQFKKQLEKDIPGVKVEINYLENAQIFQIREGGRKFYYCDFPLVHFIDMSLSEVADIVYKVATYEYLPH